MTILLANSATSALLGAISSGATTIHVQTADASKFPAITDVGQYYVLTLEDLTQNPVVREIVKCTARSSNSLTIVRAQESTTAVAFPNGAGVSLRLTAGTMGTLTDQAISALHQYPGVLRVITDLEAAADDEGVVYVEGQYGIFSETNVMYRRHNDDTWEVAFRFPELSGQITTTQITPSAITTPLLDATNVRTNFLNVQTAYAGTAQIINGAITNAKIGTLAVDTANIASAAITNAKIGTLAVDTANINTGAITTAKIGDAQITNAKIGSAAIASANIGSLEVNTFHLVNGSVTEAPSAVSSTPVTTAGTVLSLSVTVPADTKVILMVSCIMDGTASGVGSGGGGPE